jgi:hypothetical protein
MIGDWIMAEALERELATYKARLSELDADQGKFVLIHVPPGPIFHYTTKPISESMESISEARLGG